MDYIDIAAGPNNGLSAMVAHKSTETESECYQLVVSLCETIDFLRTKPKLIISKSKCESEFLKCK